MPSSSRHQFSAEPGAYQPQLQQQPNQGPATAPPQEPDLAPLEDDELDEAPPASEEPESIGSSDSDDTPAGTVPPPGADPLRAERRRSNQLEKELRKARAQLARFSEINPDEYARLQEAERKREEQERQWNLREQELNNANRRRVQAVEKERDDAREQALSLRKERLLERLFIDAEGRVGGDERSSFFDTFCKLCGGQFRLGQSEGRERLEPVDAAGQPYALDGVALSASDYMEELRRHPVYSFLFQQRNGLYQSSAEGGYDSAGVPVNLQSMSTRELYMEAMRSTTPRVPARS
ncbi:MAG: hypothetical protein ACNA8O_14365 [Cyanobacteriota bacterium]